MVGDIDGMDKTTHGGEAHINQQGQMGELLMKEEVRGERRREEEGTQE